MAIHDVLFTALRLYWYSLTHFLHLQAEIPNPLWSIFRPKFIEPRGMLRQLLIYAWQTAGHIDMI